MCFVAFIIGSARWRHSRSPNETKYNSRHSREFEASADQHKHGYKVSYIMPFHNGKNYSGIFWRKIHKQIEQIQYILTTLITVKVVIFAGGNVHGYPIFGKFASCVFGLLFYRYICVYSTFISYFVSAK